MLKLFVIATFLISALVGRLTIPKIILIAKKKSFFDEFSERKLHHTNIPRLGGVAFFPAFLFSVSLMMGLRYYLGYDITATALETDVFREIMFLIAGSTFIFSPDCRTICRACRKKQVRDAGRGGYSADFRRDRNRELGRSFRTVSDPGMGGLYPDGVGGGFAGQCV